MEDGRRGLLWKLNAANPVAEEPRQRLGPAPTHLQRALACYARRKISRLATSRQSFSTAACRVAGVKD